MRTGWWLPFFLLACARPLTPPSPEPPPPLTAQLPTVATRFPPSQLQLAGDGAVHGAELRDVETCGACHPDAVAQWRSSAHAFASFNNPLYRVSIDRVRAEAGTTASRMCAGCHDIALLTDGVMDQPTVQPDDTRAHAALTCQTCHGIESTRLDGNGSYALSTVEIPLPEKDDPASIARHRARVGGAALRTVGLCASCHRSFLDDTTGNASAFFGMDDFTPWSKSAYAGSPAERLDQVEAKDCRGCHMPPELAPDGDVSAKHGTIASHRFLGGHTWLAAMQGDSAQLERYRGFLRDAVQVDVAALRRADGSVQWLPHEIAEPAGAALAVDVVVRNDRVGHRFPGGVMDAQDTRVELTVTDAHGRVLAADDSHVLRSEVVDRDGVPLALRETNRFVAAVWNHTIEARGSHAARFTFTVPQGAALPLQLSARVLHRSRNPALRRAACAESMTASGRAFATASRRYNLVALDPCVEQPVTQMASSASATTRPRWERLYSYGQALLGSLQENVGEARSPLEAALAEAPPEGRPRVLHALAVLAGKQGRVDDALALVARAEALVGPQPALMRARGDALAAVWRWSQASDAYRQCVVSAPNDLDAWKALAVSLGSAGQPAEALVASKRGLSLQPRDPDLLRTQALALSALGASDQVAAQALEAHLHFRVPDDGPKVKALCSLNVPGCAAERDPVVRRQLHWLAPK